eukprot:COSAG06_NODE_13244_length_1278_cov_4.027990_2_plen_36_part_01
MTPALLPMATTARQKQKDEEEVDEERDDNDGANVQK